MFAGAAREAVFSKTEVIRRIKADFVPVALKAALVNNPPNNEEGRLYREIARSKIAPQGICVVNSAGKVLDWVLMFDDDKSVLAFLDRARKRFARYPNARRPVAAERYMKFPSMKLADVEDNGKPLLVLERHPGGSPCPAKPLLPQGTVLTRVFGRALGKDGKPMADTVRQEHYVEDRFHVPVGMQQELAQGLAVAGPTRFPVADDLARLLVSHAYLGQLDVNPVGAPGGKGRLEQCKFWAQKGSADEKGPIQLRIEGRSKAVGASGDGDGGDGRLWQHEVQLVWRGLIEIRNGRITRLLLLAHGSEKLRWGNERLELKGQVDVARLPAGHPIDLACKVRYGLLGEPIPTSEATTEAPGKGGPGPGAQVPDEPREQLAHALGGPFLVFQDKVQKELALTKAQKQKMRKRLADTLPRAGRFFQTLDRLKPAEREKALASFRQRTQDELAAFLEGLLETEQLTRLGQLELQQQGLFALGRPDVARQLKITDEQKKRVVAVLQQLEKQVRPLLEKAQAGEGPAEIRPKVMKARKDHEAKIEAILSAAQKKQWQAMLGKRFDLGD